MNAMSNIIKTDRQTDRQTDRDEMGWDVNQLWVDDNDG
jgi:hypothetical protein